MGVKKRGLTTSNAANARWGNKLRNNPYKVPTSHANNRRNILKNAWLENQLRRIRNFDRCRIKGNRIISLQHLGKILKIINEHTRACGGVCVLVDEESRGLGSKVQFMCEKCLKTYHYLLSPKMVGLKGTKGMRSIVVMCVVQLQLVRALVG